MFTFFSYNHLSALASDLVISTTYLPAPLRLTVEVGTPSDAFDSTIKPTLHNRYSANTPRQNPKGRISDIYVGSFKFIFMEDFTDLLFCQRP